MDRPRRYNVERSCLSCHQRKVRCDKASPCGHCMRYKVPCQYPGPNHIKRRSAKITTADVLARLESLERSIAALSRDRQIPDNNSLDNDVSQDSAVEDRLSRQTSSTGTTTTADQTIHGGVLVEDGRYINEQLLSRVLEKEKDLQSTIATPVSDGINSRRPPALKADGLLVSRFLAETDLQTMHPSQWHATQLWQIFLNRVDPLVKVIHVPSTQPRIFAAINRPQDAPADLHALLFSIYFAATTSLLADEPGHEERLADIRNYQQGLELALYHSSFLDAPTLTSLQAMSIYQMCLRYHNSGRSGWTMRGLVLRAAQSIGLHRDGKHFKLTPLECELRRRLWWHICTADSRTTEDHGVMVSGADEFCDTVFPANSDDLNLSVTAKAPPHPQECWTEMTVFLITTTANQQRQELHRVLMGHVTGKKPSELIQDLKDQLHNAYLRHGDPNIPIQRQGIMLGDVLVLKMEMYMHQKELQVQSASMSTSERQAAREKTLEIACLALERSMEMSTDELLRGFRWLSSTYIPYYVLTYILWHLCVYPADPHVDRAWQGITRTFDMTENDPSWPDPGPKWAIIARLRDKALHIRHGQEADQAQSDTEDHPVAETPPAESFYDFVNWDMGVIGFPDWTGLAPSVDDVL
ncbi:C6 transcription factor [Aspergillus heteromorphus CBS 117.55]|uniref:C6 transcription factor n=1 Tax=Aspergillus heteromorphus CBS 117.55 TaxID=1448321 RepID=A0A317V779_9EURO|nr:C6 transcription factor [Aspergillus heteromorphus CBS 117.55]PWY68682.1 C6 transcription factor [Aspergillus heteromorphus CBS 117.55]